MNGNSQKKLLIVDDVQMNIEILLAILLADYEISTALNGEDALEMLKRERPDLIMLDVIMPGMNGFEVCKMLKSDVNLKDIPVVFLSALNEEKEHQEGLALGAIDFIDKPFDINEIKLKVKNILLE